MSEGKQAETLEGLLAAGLQELGLACEPDLVHRLACYASMIREANRRINLVSRSPERRGGDAARDLIVRHVLDCLAGLPPIRDLCLDMCSDAGIADIGSGAGLPGIPLALLMQQTAFSLVERSAKKAAFLRSVVESLELGNVEVLNRDLREVRRTFGTVVFRAFIRLDDPVLRRVLRITDPAGTVAAYKGRADRIRTEAAAACALVAKVTVVPLSVPFLREERHLVLLQGRRGG